MYEKGMPLYRGPMRYESYFRPVLILAALRSPVSRRHSSLRATARQSCNELVAPEPAAHRVIATSQTAGGPEVCSSTQAPAVGLIVSSFSVKDKSTDTTVKSKSGHSPSWRRWWALTQENMLRTGRYPWAISASTAIPAQRGPCFFVATDHRQHVPEACLR
jgi:hypothetical protein